MRTIAAMVGGSVLAALAVCAAVHAADTKPVASTTLHEAMKNVVAVQTQIVWDVSNEASNDAGEPDASKLKPADWAKIANAAMKVSQVAQAYAQEGPVVVARPGQKIDGEGTPNAWGAKQVQGAIEKNPAAFRAFASQLKVAMDGVVASTRSKNAAKLAEASGTLDQICENCHTQFWYPEQK
jgi:cytochrome c556